jgi:hypothetical protein
MKQKTFYFLAIICCMSLLSSAKQSGKKCDHICRFNQAKCAKQAQNAARERYSYDLSPLTFFINL